MDRLKNTFLVTFRIACLSGLSAAAVHANDAVVPPPPIQTWTHKNGTSLEAQFSGYFDSHIYLNAPGKGFARFPTSALHPDNLAQAEQHLHWQTQLGPWKQSRSPMAKLTRDGCHEIVDGEWVSFDPGDRLEPQLYVIYYSAEWCGPCRAFSPTLKAVYNMLKDMGMDHFEIFYASWDQSATAMKRFALESAMPWKILPHSVPKRNRIISAASGSGIPCLVILNREGNILAHTYKGSEYLGPRVVLDELQRMLFSNNLHNLRARRSYFQMTLTELMADRPALDDGPPKPAIFFPDEISQIGLKTGHYRLVGEISKRGIFTLESVEPEVSPADFEAIRNVSSNWYFLPAVDSGRFVDRKLGIPITLAEEQGP